MSVPYPIGSSGATDPITNAYVVTPSDTEDLPYCPRVLILSAAGTVKMDLLGGSSGVSIPLQAGFNPIRPTRVYASGTAAVTIAAGY
jgi:hypothetical protein